MGPWDAVQPMHIDPDRCVACGNCVAVCPVGAISVDARTRRARIDADACVECFTCFRGMSMETLNPTLVRTIRRCLAWLRLRFDPEPDVCPTSAIVPDELHWPRVVRRAFSDPQVPHESTGIHGRGTEEVKTNDVTGRVQFGEAGYVVEFGRPNVGVRFHDIDRMTRRLASMGICFESNNPVTHLMTDPRIGSIRADILGERVLSAIVEFKTTLDDVAPVIEAVREVAAELDTIVSIGVSTRCDNDGGSPVESILRREGIAFVRGKTNLGLGRVTV